MATIDKLLLTLLLPMLLLTSLVSCKVMLTFEHQVKQVFKVDFSDANLGDKVPEYFNLTGMAFIEVDATVEATTTTTTPTTTTTITATTTTPPPEASDAPVTTPEPEVTTSQGTTEVIPTDETPATEAATQT